MLLDRYGIPLCHPATRDPAARRDRAALCQPSLASGGGLGLGGGRDRHLESTGPDAFLLLVRLPQRKQLKGQAAPGRKKSRRVQEDRP